MLRASRWPGCAGSDAGEPMVKTPAGVDTRSKPTPAPSVSVKIDALALSAGMRAPFSSTVA